jgi:transcriptional regulator with XRE-family HTH domain
MGTPGAWHRPFGLAEGQQGGHDGGHNQFRDSDEGSHGGRLGGSGNRWGVNRRARERLGKSQYALAEALRQACDRDDGVPDRGMVARWETGRRIPTPYWRAHLATVLQLPASVLGRAAAISKAQRASGHQEEPQESAERLRFALAHPGNTDLVSVAYLREQVRRLDERYVSVPSTALIPETGHYLGHVVLLAGHARRAEVRRELQAAEDATLMGQLVWDASQRRDHGTAAAYFDQAIHAARQRSDTAAEGLALLRKSFVAPTGSVIPGQDSASPSTPPARLKEPAGFSLPWPCSTPLKHTPCSATAATAHERSRPPTPSSARSSRRPGYQPVFTDATRPPGRLVLPLPPGRQGRRHHAGAHRPRAPGSVEGAGRRARQPGHRSHPAKQPRRGSRQAAPGDRRHRTEPGRRRAERHLRRGPRTASVAWQRRSPGRVDRIMALMAA